MKQIVIIHGGSTFTNHKSYIENLKSTSLQYERLLYHKNWKSWLAQKLSNGKDGYDVITPTLPNSANAQYDEWSLYFDKILPFLQRDVQLVGHSLGAIFLARYLNDHPSVAARRLVLIAAPYDDEHIESLGNFRITQPLKITSSVNEVHLFHSTDDPVVNFSESDKYASDIDLSFLHAFVDRGHFNSAAFEELYKLLNT